MLRKIVCLFGAVCLVMAAGLPVFAAERRGIITVLPEWKGEAVTGGLVQLFRVGSAVPEGLQLTDGLANWTVREEEGNSRILLNWLAENVKEGLCGSVEERGAAFSGLKEGVYLVMQQEPQEGYIPFTPFLVQLPDGEQWDVQVQPAVIRDSVNPQTGDHPAPIIGAMGIGLSAAILMVLVDERRK